MTITPGELPPPLLNRQQACELLNVKTRTLYNLTKAGAVRCVRLGGIKSVRYDVNDLLKLIAASKQEAPRG